MSYKRHQADLPQYGWDFPEGPRKRSESSEPPSPIIQGIWSLRSISEFSLGMPLFCRSGSSEGLSELVMQFPVLLRVFLIREAQLTFFVKWNWPLAEAVKENKKDTPKDETLTKKDQPDLEAQQRYFSYRAIFVAIVSQNSYVLIFMGYRTNIARCVAKWGIAQMCMCETKYQGGYRTFLGEC